MDKEEVSQEDNTARSEYSLFLGINYRCLSLDRILKLVIAYDKALSKYS